MKLLELLYIISFGLLCTLPPNEGKTQNINTYDVYALSIKVDTNWIDYKFQQGTHFIHQKNNKLFIEGTIMSNEFDIITCLESDTKTECLTTDVNNERVIITITKTEDNYEMIFIEYEDTIFMFASTQ